MYTARGVRSAQKPREARINHHDLIIAPYRNDNISVPKNCGKTLILHFYPLAKLLIFVGRFLSRLAGTDVKSNISAMIREAYLKANILAEYVSISNSKDTRSDTYFQ
jgi:hypothetical protein